jgi:phosphoinositide-3-kinase regulatory subunit 4
MDWVLTHVLTFVVKPHLGLITDMLVDPQKMWVVVGTNRGILTQWDIRFQIPLQSWKIPSYSEYVISQHISTRASANYLKAHGR